MNHPIQLPAGEQPVAGNKTAIRLSKITDVEPYLGGEAVYRVTLGARWIGWVGDGREWKGWRYGARRWWACWREDGDTAARWRSDLTNLTRTAALTALLEQVAK